MAEALPACTTSTEGAPFLRVLCARVGTTLIAQWALPFTAAVSVLRYRHPFQPCHPERNFVIGKANDKVESKDPMFVDTTPGNARRSHRAIIGWVDQPLRVLCARARPVVPKPRAKPRGESKGWEPH